MSTTRPQVHRAGVLSIPAHHTLLQHFYTTTHHHFNRIRYSEGLHAAGRLRVPQQQILDKTALVR